MKRRILWWIYRWIDYRGRIPAVVRWFYPWAHWCPEMDELLIMHNPEDCFCGHAPQERAACSKCGVEHERRWLYKGECVDCAPPWDGSLF